MSPQNVLQLAKLGNPQAIATLMNRHLQPKGIKAKANLKDGFLQIMLESEQVPDRKTLVAFIGKGITNLGTDKVNRIKVYAKQTGSDIPT